MDFLYLFSQFYTTERVGMEREERIAKNTYAGLETLYLAVRKHVSNGDQKRALETLEAIKSTVHLIEQYMDSRAHAFEEAYHEALIDDIYYIETESSKLVRGMAKVA